ncbi:Ig-like domain-containing protein [Marinomonas sp. TW1]|uniref:Ig-like domain-containing protein n=1 Tax=Marinomonas sp. TW1 TaxID=1561203 RepID=UPI0018D2BF93|nr:Ig-like domain-containing protein [Marinomonas sp. TW1]
MTDKSSQPSRKFYPRIAIERRIMFDGAVAETMDNAIESVSHETQLAETPLANVANTEQELEAALQSSDSSNSVYFIDGSLPDQDGLIAAIPSGANLYVIDSVQDGISQINAVLSQFDQPVDTIHLISHSTADGHLQLGNSILNADSANGQYADALASINQQLSTNADVLIYGCDLAQSEQGQATLQAIASVLDSDIAASDDVTGVDGDWHLEYQLGAIESESIIAEEWQHNLLNSLPVAGVDAYNIGQNYSGTFDVLANDTDPDGDALSVASASALFGNVVINGDNTLTYTPNSNFIGTDTISYVLQDSNGASALVDGVATVVVIDATDLPLINLPVIDVFDEDQPLVFADLGVAQVSIGNITGDVANVTLNVPVGSLTITENVGVNLTDEGNGTIRLVGDLANVNLALDTLVYTPAADYNGPVNITVGLTDELLSVPITAILPLGIDAVADIVDDSVTTDVNTNLSFNVLANDTFENASAQVTSYTNPANGTIVTDALGNVTYTPNADYIGSDSFSYTVTSNGTQETATIIVETLGPNTIPVFTLPVSESVNEEGTLVFSSANANVVSVSDLDADVLTITLESANGVLSLSGVAGLSFTEGDGTGDARMVFSGSEADINAALEGLQFSPNADFYGATSISVNADDGRATVSESIVINVSGIVDGVADDVGTEVNTVVTFDPLLNDSFEGSATITAVSVPSHGTATIGLDQKITYTPEANYRGYDSFTYTVESGGVTETVSVTMTVGTNSAPVALGLDLLNYTDGQLVVLDTSLGFLDGDLLDVLTYAAVGLPDGLSIDSVTGLITGQLAADASTKVASGDYSVTVTATDILGASADIIVDLNVVNLDPIVSVGAAVGVEDTNLEINALVNATDPDGDDIAITAATAPNGEVVINPDGSLTYIPDADYFGTDVITYTVTDSDGGSSQGIINVTLAAVADLPTISLPTLDLLNEDADLIFSDLLGQQISVGDVDGDILEVILNVPIGSLLITETANVDISQGNGANDSVLVMSGSVADLNLALNSLVYTPGEDYNGPVDLTVSLGQLGQAIEVNAVLPIGIAAVADIVDDTVNVVEGQGVSFNVLANDTFENSGRYVSDHTTPTNGTISIDAQGNVTYTPLANFVGTDTFTYVVESNGTLETATVTLNVLAAPEAVSDTATTAEDTPVTIDVLANDTVASGATLTLSNPSVPANQGTVSIVDGKLVFTPAADFNGEATISYVITDSNGGTDTGSAVVTVTPVNDAPVATLDTATTDEDTPVTIDVLANDSDVDGDTLTLSSPSVPANQGTVAIVDGKLVFTPAADFNGEATITYTVEDGNGNSDTATVIVTVNAVQDAPTGNNDTATTDEDTPVTIDVLANDSDVDGDTLTISSPSVPANQGTVAIVDGKLVFTPAADFNGEATITYTVEDGNGNSDTATVTVTVNAVQDAPNGTNDTAITDEDTPVTIDVLANDSDVDGDTLTLSSPSVPSNQGTVAIVDGKLVFTPAADFNGEATITYTVEDGNGNSDTATVTVTVNAVQDAPTGNNDTATTDEDTPVTIDVLANDSDVDGDTLTISSPSVPANQGTVAIVDGKLVFTPAADFNGEATITYTVEDGNGNSDTATVTVTVNAVQDAPIANDSTATVDEDGTVTIDALANASDVDGDTLTLSSPSVPANQGTVAIVDGKLVFTPAADFNGEATITYTVEDGNGNSDTATVIVTVNAVQDAPTGNNDTATTDEDTPVTIDVLANDSDVDGDTLTLSNPSVPANQGTVVIVDGKLVFTPATDFNGEATITYTVEDGNGNSDTATVTVTVNAVQDAPVVNDSTATVDEDGTVTIDALANASDVDGDTLTLSSPSVPANQGTVAIVDGKLVFTPAADFNGEATITYTVEDGNGNSDTATVTVTVNAVQDAPTGNNDTATTDEDTPVTIDVLANDSDVDGDTLTLSNPSVPANQGTVAIVDGKLVFTPAADFNGEAIITYTVEDGNGGSDTATVTVTVNPVQDDPIGTNDTATTDEDTPVTIDVLANDSDVDGDTLTLFNPSVPANQGTVAIVDGKLVFTPAADFNGEATITYTVEDGNGNSDTATVTVTVNPVQDAPVVSNATDTVNEDGTVTIDALANASDPDGDTLTLSSPIVPANQGTVAIVDGKLVFTPAADFTGEAIITYTVEDGNGNSDTATVTVTVNAVQDAPVVNDSTATVDEDGTVTIDALANASDVDGDTLTLSSPIVPANQGTVVIVDGKLVFTPAADFNGEAIITYTVEDGNGGSDTATVTVTVNPVQDDPIGTNDTATTDEDTPVTIDVLANDSDADGDTLTLSNPSVPANQGTVAIVDGKLVFTPAADFNGEAIITYTVEDGNGGSDTATVTVTVNAVQDAPVANDSTASVDEDGTVTIDALANASDVDGDTLTLSSPIVPANQGTVAIVDGKLVFTPAADFNGEATITYTVEDGNGNSDTATVTVTVNPVQDTPVVNDSTASVDEDGTVTIDALANASDADGDTLTLSSPSVPANQGTVSIVDGKLVFTPAADFNGEATITYTVEDGNGNSDTATVTVTVNAVQDAPVANNDSAATNVNTQVTIDVLANDTDADGDTLTLSNPVVPAGQGSASVVDGKLVFTPATDFNGYVDVTYTVSDGTDSTQATVTIAVGEVNQTPVTTNDTASVDEDGGVVVIDVLVNDTDAEGDTLSITDAQVPANQGTVAVVDGKLEFTPANDFNGEVSITYTVSDGTTSSDGTATVAVNAVQDVPTGTNDTATTDEDTPVTIDVLANDTDPDGDTLTLSSPSVPANQGTVAIVDGKLVFTPAADFNGEATITYTVEDGNGNSDTATVTVTVNAVQDAPVVNDSTATVDEDGTVTIDALANASDADGDALTISSPSVPANQGTVAIVDGKLVFTPAADFNGEAIITYTVEDGNGNSDTATVTVTVNAVQDAPTGNNDTATTDEDTPVTIDVLANDTDPDGDTLTLSSPSVPANQGTVAIVDGKLVFTPAADFNGEAIITYTVEDGNGNSDTATVTVTVNAVQDAPTGNNDTATTDEDTPVTIDVLANDTDPDGDTLTLSSPSVPANQGTVAIVDGKLVFTPAADFNGEAIITYTVEDGNGNSDTATVTVTVNAVQDAPTGNNDTATTDEDTPVTIDVLANDTDPDGDTLTLSSPSVPANQGTVAIVDGKLVFTPAADFNGEAIITYTVEDGNGNSDTATVTVTLNAVQDAPVVSNATDTVNEDGTVTIDALANASDPDGDTLTLSSPSVPANQGTVSIVDGKLVFTPVADFNGEATITYTVEDGDGNSDTATVTVTVNAVQDAPIANDSTATVDEDGTVTIDALANASDVDGDTLTLSSPSVPANQGTVSIVDGKLVFTPAADFNGEAIITYTVEDGNGNSDTATVTVTLNAVQDAPVVSNATDTVNEDGTVTIDALANASDPDGDTLTLSSPSVPANQGTVAIVDGKLVFTPAADFNGEATITYTVEDGNGNADTATVTVTVNVVQDAPVSENDTATTVQNTPVTIDVLANDTDPDGDTLTLSSPSVPANQGTVAIVDGKLVFTPAVDFNGEAIMTYTAEDGSGNSDTATVTVTVTSSGVSNTAPVAEDDTGATVEDTAVTLDVVDNDSDVDGDTLTVTNPILESGQGTVSISNNTLIFVPADNFNSEAIITYSIEDGNGGSDTARVTISVSAVEDSPVANDSTATVEEDSSVIIDVLANAADPDGDPLTIVSASVPASQGSVSIVDGKLVFTPAENFNGEAIITYTIEDDKGNSDSATVSVTVNSVQDAPVVNNTNTSITVDEGGSVVIDVLSNVSDADGDTVTVTSSSSNQGQVQILDNKVVFTPASNFSGNATITYTVSDGVNSTTASVTVIVIPNEILLDIETADFGRDPSTQSLFDSFENETLDYEPLLLDAVNGISLLPGQSNLSSQQPNLNMINNFSAFEGVSLNDIGSQNGDAITLFNANEIDRALQPEVTTNDDPNQSNITNEEQNATLSDEEVSTLISNSKLFNEQLKELSNSYSEELKKLENMLF